MSSFQDRCLDSLTEYNREKWIRTKQFFYLLLISTPTKTRILSQLKGFESVIFVITRSGSQLIQPIFHALVSDTYHSLAKHVSRLCYQYSFSTHCGETDAPNFKSNSVTFYLKVSNVFTIVPHIKSKKFSIGFKGFCIPSIPPSWLHPISHTLHSLTQNHTDPFSLPNSHCCGPLPVLFVSFIHQINI